MNEEEVRQAVSDSLNRIIEEDNKLLKFDVNERSITHRLGMYLVETVGDEWDVDVEYNRIGDEDYAPKRIPDEEIPREIQGGVPTDDLTGKTVYPDVIIHHRGSEDGNLLVIEAKKADNPGDYDRDKLCAYVERLDYEFGVFVKFSTGADSEGVDWDWDWYPFNNH